MRRLGLRSWRGIVQAFRWTFTTPAGWRFLTARALAFAAAFWVLDRYGNAAGIITIPVAVILADFVAPPPPDDLGDRPKREAGPTAP